MKKSSNKGFTLVALIIVIAILAIIMLIAIPNFSGIQQRMQVRADKQTAAQIGKAIRIWYAERVSEGGDVSTLPYIAEATGGALSIDWLDEDETSTSLKNYNAVDGLEGYISKENKPNSLAATTTGGISSSQMYAPVLTSADTAAKIMVIIQGSTAAAAGVADSPWAPAFNYDSDGDSTNDGFTADYNGSVSAIAYVEP